jgi:DNA invertase Pin-like site-specific DNA recombinase
MMTQYVAYYRVSTKMQGQSGLGLQAQKAMVTQFVKNDPILEEFTEVESGKKDNRTQLLLAIAWAKQKGARLIIAKLDRLSRNASFIFMLRDSGVDFVCADMPDANTLTVGIFAVLAQHERELISARTKAALAAKKRAGAKLGKPENLGDQARLRSIQVRKQASQTSLANVQAMDIIIDKRK